VASSCYFCGMARVRVSTTVDSTLLEHARASGSWPNDATMLDAALEALAAQHRKAEIDASYDAYLEHPADEPDEWGDLVSFSEAAKRT
jgi:hypothetical protein